MNFNPETVMIQGDLSRQDVVTLCAECDNKKVVEFGMGGSTLLLARCASELVSCETHPNWFEVTHNRLKQIKDKTNNIELHKNIDSVNMNKMYDVVFVDGVDNMRLPFANKFINNTKKIIFHDSRRLNDFDLALQFMRTHYQRILEAKFHANNSNLIIITLNDHPVVWENWNETERRTNRVWPHDINHPETIKDYIA